jgi:hypothetical protein
MPERGLIELRYANDSGRVICLLPEFWPSKYGKVDQNGDTVFLVVGGRRIPMKPSNGGYCPGCAQRVRSGDSVTGYFAYSDFELSQEQKFEQKDLEFQPKGSPCREE